jgi:hypothetical protein
VTCAGFVITRGKATVVPCTRNGVRPLGDRMYCVAHHPFLLADRVRRLIRRRRDRLAGELAAAHGKTVDELLVPELSKVPLPGALTRQNARTLERIIRRDFRPRSKHEWRGVEMALANMLEAANP